MERTNVVDKDTSWNLIDVMTKRSLLNALKKLAKSLVVYSAKYLTNRCYRVFSSQGCSSTQGHGPDLIFQLEPTGTFKPHFYCVFLGGSKLGSNARFYDILDLKMRQSLKCSVQNSQKQWFFTRRLFHSKTLLFTVILNFKLLDLFYLLGKIPT